MTRYEENMRALDEARTEHLSECAGCSQVIDRGCDKYFFVDGEIVCRYCVKSCSICNDLIDDTRPDLGPAVTTDRRMDSHAVCVAEELLGMELGDMDYATREEVEAGSAVAA